MVTMREKYVIWFDEIGIEDIPIVGGKNASIGEMIRNLPNINVPKGFTITTNAYKYLLEESGIRNKIEEILSDVNTSDMDNLEDRGHRVRELIRNTELPKDLEKEIVENYKKLCEMYNEENLAVAVRSSATAEDLCDASFAGQQESYLNVSGKEELIKACKNCFASLFTNRAISYRVDKKFNHFEVYLSIGVQKMVRSDSATSGVIFSIDTESGFKNVVFITAAYGLGENVVQGAITPDEYYVFKPTLGIAKKPIIGKTLGTKEIRMVYDSSPNGWFTKNVYVGEKERNKFALSDDEILKLAKWAVQIEKHYTEKARKEKEKKGEKLPKDFIYPMDIEWAKDGDGINIGTGEFFIVQARPETFHSQKSQKTIKKYKLKKKSKVIAIGKAVGEKIGKGTVRNILNVKDIHKFKKGDVLVTAKTDPDWEPIMKIASAIVTDQGGRTCHAAIISRELGIPCIVGCGNATKKLITGGKVTVSCCEGETGKVYEGLLPFEIEEIHLDKIPKTRTKIMMIAGIPEQAFVQGQIPNDGVGLAREEFIINSHIGIHPLALINFEKLKNDLNIMEDMHFKGFLHASYKRLKEIVKTIEEKTKGYENKTDFFVDRLAEGIGRIASAFYPNDVIVRLSDFKTNEYANLVGGFIYEPEEENPMIGWRGASRYYDEKYIKAFELECKAILKVREEMGLTNVKVMIPFCRTPKEGRKVIETMKKFGLIQGKNGLEIYVMVEVPSNVISADEFADIFDGFSIGSNDLTQLALGLDRDSELVSHLYNENEETIKRLISHVIKVAKEKKIKIGICGQAPSDFPEFAEFLVEQGVDSISLQPDVIIKTRMIVAEKEKELDFQKTKQPWKRIFSIIPF